MEDTPDGVLEKASTSASEAFMKVVRLEKGRMLYAEGRRGGIGYLQLAWGTFTGVVIGGVTFIGILQTSGKTEAILFGALVGIIIFAGYAVYLKLKPTKEFFRVLVSEVRPGVCSVLIVSGGRQQSRRANDTFVTRLLQSGLHDEGAK